MAHNDLTRRNPGNFTPDQLENLLTVDQLAERLHVRKATVYGWCHRGQIPFYRLGRLSLFDPHDVAEWLSAKRVEAVGGTS